MADLDLHRAGGLSGFVCPAAEMFHVLHRALHGVCADDPWTATPGKPRVLPRDRPRSFTVIGAESRRP